MHGHPFSEANTFPVRICTIFQFSGDDGVGKYFRDNLQSKLHSNTVARGVEILFLSLSYSKCSGWMPLVGQLMLTVFQHIFANQVAYFEASACWYV